MTKQAKYLSCLTAILGAYIGIAAILWHVPEQRSASVAPELERAVMSDRAIIAVLSSDVSAPSQRIAEKDGAAISAQFDGQMLDAQIGIHGLSEMAECKAIMSGVAEVWSKRVNIKINEVQCIEKDGELLKEKVNGYALGSDGRFGVPGQLRALDPKNLFIDLDAQTEIRLVFMRAQSANQTKQTPI